MLNLLKMLKLQNVYLKHGSMQNRLAYKKRRNYCVTSLKKKNVDYFNNQEINLVRDNKMFWKTISSYFVNNRRYSNKKG